MNTNSLHMKIEDTPMNILTEISEPAVEEAVEPAVEEAVEPAVEEAVDEIVESTKLHEYKTELNDYLKVLLQKIKDETTEQISKIQNSRFINTGASKQLTPERNVIGNERIFVRIWESIELTCTPTDIESQIFFNIWGDDNKTKRIVHISLKLKEKKFVVNHKSKIGWAKEYSGDLVFDSLSTFTMKLQLINCNSNFSDMPTHLRIQSDIFNVPIHHQDGVHHTTWMYPLMHYSFSSPFAIENITSNGEFAYSITI